MLDVLGALSTGTLIRKLKELPLAQAGAPVESSRSSMVHHPSGPPAASQGLDGLYLETNEELGWRLWERLAFLLWLVPPSEHRAGTRWQARCASLGLGHGGAPSSRALNLSADHPASLSVPSSANVKGPFPGCGLRLKAARVLCEETPFPYLRAWPKGFQKRWTQTCWPRLRLPAVKWAKMSKWRNSKTWCHLDLQCKCK